MTQRMEQVNSVFQKDIAQYALRHAPSIKYISTITYVSINADLSHAKVGVTTFPEKKSFINEFIKNMQRTRSQLQLSLARDHRLKNIPTLEFVADQNTDKVERIDELFNEVDNERR